ncbi:SMP-30/gluconolactonase/LRE family protein [Sphingomonas bisphenolicum]|nr:SMP-30/gluconolactonase/LRE family protein [Sphingomonas bisphenolicum]
MIESFRCGIGEGVLWDEREQRVYAVDILARQIVRYDPIAGSAERFDVGEIIGSMALRETGGAVLGLATGVSLFDFDSGEARLLVDVEPEDRSLLLTEGKADPAGRFVVSSFAMAMREPVGSFFAIGRDGGATRLRGGVTVPNGLAWSPDGKTIYFADSARNAVFAADYDLERGLLSNERLFAETAALGGIPDGATVDSEGNYWVTICQAGQVACFDDRGKLVRSIELPCKWVSSLAFGGAGLDRLFVTSLDPSLMNMGSDPLGGHMFVIDEIDATGLGATRTLL